METLPEKLHNLIDNVRGERSIKFVTRSVTMTRKKYIWIKVNEVEIYMFLDSSRFIRVWKVKNNFKHPK